MTRGLLAALASAGRLATGRSAGQRTVRCSQGLCHLGRVVGVLNIPSSDVALGAGTEVFVAVPSSVLSIVMRGPVALVPVVLAVALAWLRVALVRRGVR
jgi:hypothetical protein